MSLFRMIHRDDYAVAIWRLEESSAELSSSLASQWGQSFLCPYPNEKRQQEFFACRMAASALHIHPEQIDKHPQGWPILKNEGGFISFSHCKHFAAVLHSNTQANIGIDIEHISERFIKVASRYLSPQEWEDVQARFNEKKEMMRILCLYWTAKEALFKAVHSQNIDFQQAFQIEPIEQLTDEGNLNALFGQQQYHLHYRFEEDFCYCICIAA